VEYLIDEDLRFHSYPKEILSLVSLELWHRAFLGRSRATTAAAQHVPLTVGG
jgi:hypothetical protein